MSDELIGLMQPRPLRVGDILDHAKRVHPDREIVSRMIDEPDWRGDYRGLAERAARAASALRTLGVGPGDRVATLAWNTVRHLDLFYAVPGLGAVLATANPRLFDDQIVFTLNHGGARWLLYDRNLAPLVERLAPRLAHIEHYILLCDAERHAPGPLNALCYDTLLSEAEPLATWASGDENAAAVLCYTSGTTGDPKGVLYSHRSIVLHAMAVSSPAAFAISAFDVVMPCSSLYHATGWGLPYVAPMQGSAIILPGDRLTPENLHALVQSEGVTFTVGVPTIWTAYLSHVEAVGGDTGALKRILIGGAAVPLGLAHRLRDHGVFALQAWGMTEMSPVGTASLPSPAAVAAHGEATDDFVWSRQGRPIFGVELRIADEAGEPLPTDGATSGRVLVRGPWVTQRYYRAEVNAVDDAGWFDTGDIAVQDATGFLRLTDRAKDVIKSGGEWISSIDVENIAAGIPGVRTAAVIGAPHPRWDERPVLILETDDGEPLAVEDVIAHLTPRMARWWLPDAVLFEPVPLTSTGKIDKKALRARHADIFANAPTAPD